MWKPQAILPCAVLATYIQHRHKIVAGLFRKHIFAAKAAIGSRSSVTDDHGRKRNAGRAAGIRDELGVRMQSIESRVVSVQV
jgi:hypothetical protein